MGLPNGAILFKADVIDVDTVTQHIFYVVDTTYESAFKQFTEYANSEWHIYEYYFFEAGAEDVENFCERHEGEQIQRGIYDW